jgi:hypothetical protein
MRDSGMATVRRTGWRPGRAHFRPWLRPQHPAREPTDTDEQARRDALTRLQSLLGKTQD